MEGNTSKKAKRKRETHNCCVPQCSAVKNAENRMHYVPAGKALRQKWTIAIKTGKKLSIRMRVCSRHFKPEDYKTTMGTGRFRRLKPGVIPSLNLPVRPHEKVLSTPEKQKNRLKAARARKRTIWSAINDATSDDDDSSNKESSESEGEGSINPEEADGNNNELLDLEVISEDEIKLKDAGVQVDFESDNPQSVFSSILSSNGKLFSATGIHSIKLLDSLSKNFVKIAPDGKGNTFSLGVRDRIILTMMKIKLGLGFSALAAILGVTVQTCSNYFYDTVIILAKILKCMVTWPGKEDVMKNMPKCFSNYRFTRAILDCYEVPIERPKCLRCRIKSYSHYKKNHTAKILMVGSPSGLITLCPPAFGGRASDKVVTNYSNIYDLCDPPDGLMVDKGFAIEEECINSFLRLIRPPFLRKNKYSKAESFECAKIARARVHVERIIQRVREYAILKNKIPWNVVPYIDEIVIIVSALVNLGKPILADDKF